MSKIRLKQLLLRSMPYLGIATFAAKLAESYRLAMATDIGAKLLTVFRNLGVIFQQPNPSLHPVDWLFGCGMAVLFRLIVEIKMRNAKKFRHGVEHGSARWGTAVDIAPYIDSDFSQNVLFTASERIMLGGRPPDPKHARNKNILVIGGSGSGKTRFFVKPNLMQMHSSYVVTDPKGSILVECGKLLQRGGYLIRSFNLIDFAKSGHYNPFAYIHSERDILKLVNCLISNTRGEGAKSESDFWEKAERLLFTAFIVYIWYEAPKEEQNFSLLLELLDASETREEDENYKNAVDILFDRLAAKNPHHFAVRQYVKYKMSAGKTAKSILISCGARLAPFDIGELRELMEYDDLELDTLGERKSALFVIVSDTDATFNFIAAMMYTQLFDQLCYKTDNEHGGKLPIHVRCLLDEFANTGQIPQFAKLIATIRSREISACIVLQAQSQLKSLYKDDAETIAGNCDATLFLGGKEKTTLQDISEMLGKETIDFVTTSETHSRENSLGISYQKLGKDLMSRDELAVMDGAMCILMLRGVRPFLSRKYDITQHPHYRYLADADPKNAFDIQRYMRRRTTILKPEEVFETYEIVLDDLQAQCTAELY